MAGQRAALAGAQQNLAQGQLGLGQFQTGLGQSLQGFQGTDIARAGQVGAADQAQAQAVLGAQTRSKQISCIRTIRKIRYLWSRCNWFNGRIPSTIPIYIAA